MTCWKTFENMLLIYFGNLTQSKKISSMKIYIRKRDICKLHAPELNLIFSQEPWSIYLISSKCTAGTKKINLFRLWPVTAKTF